MVVTKNYLLIFVVNFCCALAFDLNDGGNGNWSVDNCILAEFSMRFVIHFNNSDLNQTQEVDVSALADVDTVASHCGDSEQLLALQWTDVTPNGTVNKLDRSLKITFTKDLNTSSYGVSRIHGVFDLFVVQVNTTDNHKYTVDVDSGILDELIFQVPLDSSYFCSRVEAPQLKTFLATEPKVDLPDSNLTILSLKLDAFRDAKSPDHQFRSATECQNNSSDVVPIIVGIALAVLVVLVLVVYVVGRQRHRRRGYESV